MAAQPAKKQINLLEFPFDERPHEFVMLASQYLRVNPQSPAVQLRLIGAYTRLGCRQLALATWEQLPEQAQRQTESIRTEILGLNNEVVRICKPTPRFRRNFAAVCRHNPHLRELDLDALFAELAEAYIVRCSDGTWQAVPPGIGGWLDGFRDHQADAEKAGASVRGSQGPPPGILVSPLGHGLGLRQAFSATSGGHVNSTSPLYVLEPDPRVFVLALSLTEMAEALGDERVRVFVGPHGADELRDWILSHDRWTIPTLIVSGPQARARLPAGINKTIEGVDLRRKERIDADIERLGRLYAGRDASYWETRLSGSPLRIMAFTSRFTTVLQHTLRALLDAYADMGHETRLLLESADHERISSIELARTCLEFEPDVLLLADGARLGMPEFPENLPVVSWMQDRLPRLLTKEVGRSIGPLDLVVGMFKLEFVEKYEYPGDRYVSMPLLADTKAMRDRTFTEEELKPHRCDVSYVSHRSEAPEAIVRRFTAGMEAQMRGLLQEVHDRIRAVYESGGAIHYPLESNAIVAAAERGRGTEIAPQFRDEVLWHVWHELNDAIYRQQVLEWTAAADVDLRIYGRGWEDHPRLGQFARGPLSLDDVPAVCRASRINLQVVPYGAAHHRMLNGMAAGGFFLVRQHPFDELHNTEIPLWRRVRELGIGSAGELASATDPVLRERLARYHETLKLNTPADLATLDDLWMRLEDSARTGFRGRTGHIFPHMPDYSFRTRTEFHALLDKYLNDEQARTAVIEENQGIVEESYSYRRGAHDILEAWRTSVGRAKKSAV